MAEWFYAREGKQVGPIALVSMINLLHEGLIDQSTQIRTSAGTDWQPLKHTDLAQYLPSPALAQETEHSATRVTAAPMHSGPSEMPRWFYVTNGKHVGPVVQETMAGLLNVHVIDGTTLVRSSEQADWQPLNQSALAAYAPMVDPQEPAYVPIEEQSFWRPFPAATLAIAAINLTVFIAMAVSLRSVSFSGPDALVWGANYGPSQVIGEWWRLLTSNYVHFDLQHIVFNMFALLIFGWAVESRIGSVWFAVIYTACGVAGSMFSISLDAATVSAGASGAIFGLLGVMIGLMIAGDRTLDRAFVVQNLIIGAGWSFAAQVDWAAHLGGFTTGAALGLLAAVAARRASIVLHAIGLLTSAVVVAAGVALAINWYPSRFQALAQHGDADAANGLAEMYFQGDGVKQDYSEAARWYLIAADQRDAYAQGKLGYLYDVGRGVRRDYGQATRWYELAANQGDMIAQYNLATHYFNGQGAPRDHTLAMKWYRRAASQGDAESALILGRAELDGDSVSIDFADGYFWLGLALKGGKTEAAALRARAARQLTPTKIQELDARVKAWSPGPQPSPDSV